jgi:hypothetical protein
MRGAAFDGRVLEKVLGNAWECSFWMSVVDSGVGREEEGEGKPWAWKR